MKKWLIFIGTLVLTCVLGQNEALRKIPGERFIGIWLGFAAILVITAMCIAMMVVFFRKRAFEKSKEDVTINHTDMPHAYAGESAGTKKYPWHAASSPVVVWYYYLLRLYLRGIVRYKWERGRPRLWIDEQCLEQVKAEGGRHSALAARIVKNIREKPGHSFDTAFAGSQWNHVEMHEVHKAHKLMEKSLKEMLAFVMAAVMGVVWGVLLAKFELGLENDRPVFNLLLTMIIGGIASRWMVKFFVELGSAFPGFDLHWYICRLQKNPHQLQAELLNQANSTLLAEKERHQLLNGYFSSPSSFWTLAKETEKTTFLHQFALYVDEECQKALEAAERARRLEAARKELRAAEKASSSRSSNESSCSSCSACSSCSSCSSCASCSSCGGCGGCGGCGD